MRSFICELLKSRDCTPKTKEMASMRLDLPDPLGPMTEVKSRKGPMRWTPAYDLKFSSSMYVTGMVSERTCRHYDFLIDTVIFEMSVTLLSPSLGDDDDDDKGMRLESRKWRRRQ